MMAPPSEDESEGPLSDCEPVPITPKPGAEQRLKRAAYVAEVLGQLASQKQELLTCDSASALPAH